MGVDTLSVPLSVILTELYLNIHFSVMASQICIKMVLGTFFQLVKIANRFLRVFSKLDAPIRSIFQSVHGNPIFRLDYALHFLMGRTEGKNGSFYSYKDENPLKFFFFHDSPRGEKNRRTEAMPKFLIVMCICGIFATVTVLHSLGALMYLKLSTAASSQ